MLDKIQIVSLDTIDINNMTPVYERVKFYGKYDYSRWVFRDESTKYYYKVWNETYVKNNNIISGLLSGLYDETTVPALIGLIFYNGYCRGYIMDDLGDEKTFPHLNPNDMISDKDYSSFYNYILKKIKETNYFPYDFCQKHVRKYKSGFSLMDLEGVHHIDEYGFRLKEHNERNIKGKFINNLQFENDIKNLIYKPLKKEDFLDMEMHMGKGGKEIILNNYKLKTVRDVVDYFSNKENLNNTIKILQPSNWQYFNCMLAEFRHNVGDHHVLGWENMTKEYYENLDVMSDDEIAKFLLENPIPFEMGFVKHGFHRACSMIGRLIKGKKYIPFYMDIKKYGGHIPNPLENINFIRVLDNFGIPRNEYSISNSAILSIMGIKSRIKNNGDLDIIISSKVRNFLQKTKMKLPQIVHPFGKDSGKFKIFGCKDDDDLVYNYSVDILGFNFTEPRFYFNRMHRVMNSQHRSFDENYKIKDEGKKGVENFKKNKMYNKYPFRGLDYYKWGFELIKKLEIIR